MANLFSPNDDILDWIPDVDDDQLEVLERVPPPVPTPTQRATDHTASIRISNVVGRNGKTIQKLTMTDPSTWTQRDAEQLAYLGMVVSSNYDRSELKIPSGKDFAPGIQKFANYVLTAHQTQLPDAFAKVLDAATQRYTDTVLAEEETRIAERSSQDADTFLELLFAEVDEAIAAPQAAAAPPPQRDATEVFLDMRLWDPEVTEPYWLRFTSEKSHWLTDPPAGKFVRQWYQHLPDGCCALRALASAGVLWRNLKTVKPDEWVGASVRQLCQFLKDLNIPFAVYDSLGREVVTDEGDGRPGRMRFVVANGHITAFASAKKEPFEVIAQPGSSNRGVIEMFDKHFDLRGSNSLEVSFFYENCGIRAACIMATETPDIAFDINKAYPSFLLDPTCVFPVAEGAEVINNKCQVLERAQIVRSAFYLVNTDLTNDERLLLRSNGMMFWFYGDALLRAFPDHKTFDTRGSFVPASERPGLPFADDDETRKIRRALALLCEDLTHENVNDKLRRQFFRQLTQYTGFLEKNQSLRHYAQIDVHEDERAYLDLSSKLYLDYTTVFTIDGGEHHADLVRGRHWKTTGRLAKLALYCYTTAKLITMVRRVQQIDRLAVVTMARTDSVGLSTYVTEEMARERLADLIGDAPGLFKFQEVKPVSGFAPRRIVPTYTLNGCDLAPPPLLRMTLQEANERIAMGWKPRMMLVGPPGSGKTFWMKNVLIKQMQEQKRRYSVCTQMKSHAQRINARTNESMLSTKQCFDATIASLRDSVLIVDEVGLANPCQLDAFISMRTNGLVLIGDGNQLSKAGDLEAIARRLNMPLVQLGFHDNDRYGGDKKMHAVLELLTNAIGEQRAAGELGCDGFGTWPVGLELQLEAAGLRFVDQMPSLTYTEAGAEKRVNVLGWRHKYTDEFGGSTVHSAQGSTIEGRILVTDFRCDPRLLYTAISRAKSLDDVTVMRNVPRL